MTDGELLRVGVDLCWGRPWLVRPDGLLALERDLAVHAQRSEVAAHRASCAMAGTGQRESA